MAQAHCTTCRATVTVDGGACLVGHPIAATDIVSVANRSARGRRRSNRRMPSLADILGDSETHHRHQPSAAAVEVLPPESPRRVGPLMEMFGFSETTDLPWIEIDESTLPEHPVRTARPPRPARSIPKQRTSPVDRSMSRPGAVQTNRPSLFDGMPRLADLVAVNPGKHENTGTLVERMWEATDDFEPMDSWMPKADYVDRLGQQPVIRWVVAGVIAIVAVISTVSLIVGGISGADPVPASDQAVAAVAEARQGATQLRDVLGTLSDPSSSGEQLNEAAVALDGFDSTARSLGARSSAVADLDGGADIAVTLSQVSDVGVALGRRTGSTLTYRLVFERAFVIPELPTTADLTEAADLSFELSAMVADTERALAQLPFDPVLEDHRVSAAQALADIEVMSERYVEALRAEKPETANRHRQSIIDLSGGVHDELDLLLPAVGRQVSQGIDEYEEGLSAAITALRAIANQQ